MSTRTTARDAQDAEQYRSPLLTVGQLVERVPGTNPAYWAELRYRGGGPEYVKLSQKRVLYPEHQFLQWLASKRRTSTKGEVSA